MLIKCWGSRGSIPVSGPEYLKYGGDTTCLEIRTRSDDIIIVDAGTGMRRLGKSLVDQGRFDYHFLITHGHWDHIMGFPFFKPLLYEKTRLFMHSAAFHEKYIENMISKIMSPPNYPLRLSELEADFVYKNDAPEQFEIGSVTIIPIPLSHPNTGNGYKFIEDGKSFVFLTDNELGYVHPGGRPYEDYLEFVSGVNLLIHDAEYTPREYETVIRWGHSSYTDVLRLAVEAGVEKVGLFHINQERSDQQMDAIIEGCNIRLKKNTQNTECFAVGSDMVFDL